MAISIEKQLEQYTLQHPKEVLLVAAEINGEVDEILIFKGFSSSLMRSTVTDPDRPVMPNNAEITGIDRLMSPYRPDQPNYLERGISWAEFSQRLTGNR